MVKQYPHKITYATVAESSQDGQGNWVAGGESEECWFMARAEANSKGQMISSLNGTQIVFDWLLHAPLSTPDLVEGTSLSGSPIGTATVKRFVRGMFNVRIWV